MVKSEDIMCKISSIIEQTQHSAAVHEKCRMQLKSFYVKVPLEEFYSAFQKHLEILISIQYKPLNVNAEKSIHFCASFVASVASINNNDENFQESEFFLKVCNFLLTTVCSVIDVVRYRSCQLLQILFEKLLDVELDNDLCSKIEDAMMNCIEDEKYLIRVIAVNVLKHFQNPTIQNDAVGNALIKHMMHDPSPHVRKACVDVIAPKRDVIPLLVLKARDVDVNVRLCAFKKVAKYPRHFKIKEKQAILWSGLFDDSSLIKNYINKVLILKWFDNFDDNFIDLIRSLKRISTETCLENSMNLIKEMLKILFKNKSLQSIVEALEYDDEKIITNLFNWERLLYWCTLLDYLKTSNNSNQLYGIMPDTISLCNRIKMYMEEQSALNENWIEFEAIVSLLFNVLYICDFYDPCSQTTVKDLIIFAINKCNFGQKVITSMFQCLKECFSSQMDYSFYTNEIISSILYGKEEKQFEQTSNEIEQQKSHYLELKHSLQETVDNNDFAGARRIQLDIELVSNMINKLEGEMARVEDLPDLIEVNDQALEKTLNVLIVHLQLLKVREYSTIIATMKSEIVNQLLTHPNATIVALAMKCFGLMALLNKDVATECLTVLSVPLARTETEQNVEVIKSSILGVVDILLVHGVDIIASPFSKDLSESWNEEDLSTFVGGVSLTEIVRSLLHFVDHSDYGVSNAALKSLLLLVSNKIAWSSSLLARLILRWFAFKEEDDDDDDDASSERKKVHQLLGRLFSLLPTIYNDGTCVQNATIPVINEALDNYELYVDADNISSFMINLLKLFNNGGACQINLAYRFLDAIKNSTKDNQRGLVYAKKLLLLKLTAISKSAIDELLKFCDIIREELTNASIRTYITKFMSKLDLIECSNNETISTNASSQI